MASLHCALPCMERCTYTPVLEQSDYFCGLDETRCVEWLESQPSIYKAGFSAPYRCASPDLEYDHIRYFSTLL